MLQRLKHYNFLKEQQIILSYSGLLNGEIIAALLQLVDARLKAEKLTVRRKKNIINILIECLQNMYYHKVKTESQANDPLNQVCIMMTLQPNCIILDCGNHVDFSQSLKLTTRIDELNRLPQSQLHELYLDTLNSGTLSDKGGAGLGIMRTIKEAGHPLAYNIEPVNTTTQFFWLHINIPLQEADFALPVPAKING